MARQLEAHHYQTHEFGDFVWLAAARRVPVIAACG
jgi:hypothetical protein